MEGFKKSDILSALGGVSATLCGMSATQPSLKSNWVIGVKIIGNQPMGPKAPSKCSRDRIVMVVILVRFSKNI